MQRRCSSKAGCLHVPFSSLLFGWSPLSRFTPAGERTIGCSAGNLDFGLCRRQVSMAHDSDFVFYWNHLTASVPISHTGFIIHCPRGTLRART